MNLFRSKKDDFRNLTHITCLISKIDQISSLPEKEEMLTKLNHVEEAYNKLKDKIKKRPGYLHIKSILLCRKITIFLSGKVITLHKIKTDLLLQSENNPENMGRDFHLFYISISLYIILYWFSVFEKLYHKYKSSLSYDVSLELHFAMYEFAYGHLKKSLDKEKKESKTDCIPIS